MIEAHKIILDCTGSAGLEGAHPLQTADSVVAVELFKSVTTLGYKNVAIDMVAQGHSQSGLSLESDETDCIDFSKRAAAHGICIDAIVLSAEPAFDLAASWDHHHDVAKGDQLSKQFPGIIAALDRAAWLGAGQIVLPPVLPVGKSDGSDKSYDDAMGNALAALSALRFAAQRQSLEIDCRLTSQGICRSPAEARSFLDAVNSPWIGACVDINIDSSLASSTCADRESNAIEWLHILCHRARMIRWIGLTDITAAQTIMCGARRARFDGAMVYRPGKSTLARAAWDAIPSHVI